MEHLTRNTNNDRIIYTIESIKNNNKDILTKELKELVNKVITVITGILSSIISGSIISILKNEEKIQHNTVLLSIFFIITALAIWVICLKWVVPRFSNILYKERINIDSEKKHLAVKRFNTEIMQKVAEINEIVEVIGNTDIPECKILNYTIALYKFQEIVDFLYEKFVDDKLLIRKNQEDGVTEILRYSFNEYTVSAIVTTVSHISIKMQELIEDRDIRKLEGHELLKADLNNVCKKFEKIDITKR